MWQTLSTVSCKIAAGAGLVGGALFTMSWDARASDAAAALRRQIPSSTVTAVGSRPDASPTRAAPELPRATVDVSMPGGSRRSIRVNARGDLQAALNTARPGDEVVVQAGATFTGPFTLRAKSGTGWIIVRSSGTLPSVGTRVHPGDASQMPKLVSKWASESVVQTAPGAHNYRLIGLEITAPAGQTSGGALISLGDGSSAQNTIASMAHDLVLDRMYIHGTPTLDFRRCIALNSGSTAIVDSYISECHAKGFDSQAIAGWNGSGPYRIENNYLEGAGENVMFGGADPKIANMLPRDIVIRRNYVSKPAAWKGVWEVKNLLELKIGQRVLIDGNVFENNWSDAQTGYAILFKSVNQEGTAPWSQTSDVTFQNNVVRNSANGVSLAANPESNPAVPAARLRLSNNLLDRIGSGDYPGGRLLLIQGIQGLTIRHNTGFGGDYAIYFAESHVSQLVMQDNIFGTGGSVVKGDAVGSGTNALRTYATPSYVFTKNIVVGASSSGYPPNNYYPPQARELGLDSSFNLPSRSPYLTASTTGGPIGADISTINAATSGVTQ